MRFNDNKYNLMIKMIFNDNKYDLMIISMI